MTHESIVAAKWLYGVLAADSTITGIVLTYGDRYNIHDGVAPPNAPYPFISFEELSMSDVMNVSTARIGSRGTFKVVGVGQTWSYGGVLQTLAERIDALLHSKQGSVSGGGYMLSSVRQSPFKQATFEEGKPYRQLGGIYELFPQGS